MFLMMKSFQVKNFRGFSQLKLDSMEWINLVIGKNNVGKTALLEAMLLILGPANPAISIFFNQAREFNLVSAGPEDVWGWLFHNRALEVPIQLSYVNEANINQN